MTPPESVRVGPYTFTITVFPEIIETGAYGDTHVSKTAIRYSPDLSPAMERATILHEVLHATAHSVGIDDTAELNQETWIQRIDGALLAVLCDNPDLIAYLTAPPA